MLMIATLLIMLACGYSQYRNGLFTSFTTLISVFLSGLVAFGFWEPIADWLDPYFQGSAVAGCEDMVVLMTLFSVPLFALRVATNMFAPDLIEENGAIQHFGGGGVGLIIGYFLAGFLLCALQTLPLEERFMDFQPRTSGEPIYRSIFPGDRVWLSLISRLG